ncbi:MAG TPA: hypothetical protein VMU05_18440 [Dongiaceae bacterium]|nr:hypothetical protein [Dongiaceae bacterium]
MTLALVLFPTKDPGPGKLYILKGRLEKIGKFGCEEHVGFVRDTLRWIGDTLSGTTDPETAFRKIAALLDFAKAVVASSPVRKTRANSIDDALVNAGFDAGEFDLLSPVFPIKSASIH